MSTNSIQLEKFLLILSLGLTEAVKAGVLCVDDAEKLLYSPKVLALLSRIGLAIEVLDLVHLGTELEDINSLIPDRLEANLNEMSSLAVSKLRTMPQLPDDYFYFYEKLAEIILGNSLVNGR